MNVSQTDNNDIDSAIENCINYIQLNNISNPVEILRYIQSKIIQGRSLDVQDIVTEIEGETNFIIVNRNDLLRTAFEEINSISNYRVTLEVQFYDEVSTVSVSQGSPQEKISALKFSALKVSRAAIRVILACEIMREIDTFCTKKLQYGLKALVKCKCMFY